MSPARGIAPDHSSRLRVRLPARPRFLQELVVIPLQDGILIDGADQVHVLEGAKILKLLPRLIPLLDGTRTLDQIRRELLDVAAADIHSAVSSLSRWALIEDGEYDKTTSPRASENLETLAFFRRYAAAIGVHPTGRQAYEALRSSEVFLIDSGQSPAQIGLLRRVLEQSGIERVAITTLKALASAPILGGSRQSLIVSSCFTGEDPHTQTVLDQWCHENNRPWLRAVMDPCKGHADLGPFFDHVAPCYQCFIAVHGDPGISPHLLSGNEPQRLLDAEFLLSLLAVEVVYYLSSIGPLVTDRGFRRYDLQNWNSENLRLARGAGCSRCRPITAESPLAKQIGVMDTALIFEDYVGLQRKPRVLRRVEDHASAVGTALGRQFPRLAQCAPVALPNFQATPHAPEIPSDRDSSSGQQLGIEALAAMLQMTAGIREVTSSQKIQRWTATAGNLGSVEVFVVVRDVAGLEPGIYFYQPDDHSLARFRTPRTIEPASLMERISPLEPGGLPDVLLLFTGAFHKVAQKYAQFGYRLLHFDAGIALSQLHFIAKSLKAHSCTLTRWVDEVIERELNLSPALQLPTAVAAIWNESVMPCGQLPSPRRLRREQPGSIREVREFSGRPVEQILEMLMRDSRLNEQDIYLAPFEIADRPQKLAWARRASHVLPVPRKIHGIPRGLLTRRESVRSFRADPLSLSQLASMLYLAHEGDRRDWPEEHLDGQGLRFLVVANAVDGLPSGVFDYDCRNHGLHAIKGKISPSGMAELFLQTEFATAPAVVWIAGNLAAACARLGSFGHRQLLLRAGAAANRLWLAALDSGLEGSIVAGLIVGAARRHVGLDGYQQASLLAFAVGHAANPGSPEGA